MPQPEMPSVRDPEFEGTTTNSAMPRGEPQPRRTTGSSQLVAAVSLLVGVVVAVALFVPLTGDDVTAESDAGAAAAIAAGESPIDARQLQLIEPGRYRTRPVGLAPVRVATEGPQGFIGSSRWEGRWYVSRSADGIDWEIDLEAPLAGVPPAFRPGTLEGQRHVSLQRIADAYWGRFVSRSTAGAEGAVLTLTSDDGQTWARPSGSIPEFDRFTFGGRDFGPPDQWVQRWLSGSRLQQSFDGGSSYVTIPRLTLPGAWEPVEIAWSSAGIAVLYFDDDIESYRLALTTDAGLWETVALAERGRSAVHLVVVGTEEVLLTAANPNGEPVELIVPHVR